MVDQGPPWSLRSVSGDLGTGAILAKLAAILAAHSRTVCKDGTTCTPEERSGRVIHSFLPQLAMGVDLIPGLERVTVVGIDPDEWVLLMQLLFSVQVTIYLTYRLLFACLGELPADGLPLVVEIPNEAFAARRSVRTVPRVAHVTHLGGISLLDWQTKPCERDVSRRGWSTYYWLTGG